MKVKPNLGGAALALALLLTLNVPLSTAFAQGSLTPPGAPGATMLTLSQIAPRTPISSAPFIITKPGSYYLTTNLTVSTGDGIDINTNGVTLDLNGFAISSTAPGGSGNGIFINSNIRNISIADGFIQGGATNNGSGFYSGNGFYYGIYYLGTAPANVLISRISISGCSISGIFLNTGDSTVVESCTVRTVGNYGIFASTVKNSSAIDCGGTAIYGDQVSDCRGQSDNFGNGILATAAENCNGYSGSYNGLSATTALNCYGYSDSGNGIYTSGGAHNCYGYSNGDEDGIDALNAQDCYGYSVSGFGIQATVAENCYGYSPGVGTAVSATSAVNCYGYNVGNGDGIDAATALSCYGTSSGGGDGIYASYTAQNCYAYSGSYAGLATANAQNCYGYSNGNSYGVFATDIAVGCYGFSNSGTGVYAFIANVCHGATATGTALSTSHNVNSF